MASEEELTAVVGADSAKEFMSGRRMAAWSTVGLLAWILVVALVSLSGYSRLWMVAMIATVIIAMPVSVTFFVVGRRRQLSAGRSAAAHLHLPEGVTVLGGVLSNGPEAIRRYAENVRASQGPQTIGEGLSEARRAVPRSAWIMTVCGLILLVIGVALSIASTVFAALSMSHHGLPSPLVFGAAAIVCYICGFPLMLSFVRSARRGMKNDRQ